MRKAGVLVLAAFVLSSLPTTRGDDDPEPKIKPGAELRKLRGKWTGTRKAPKGVKEGTAVSYEFIGDKVTVTNGDTTYEATVTIDTKVKPPKLNLFQKEKGFGTSHVFKLEGDKLYLASGTKKKLKDVDPFDPKKAGVTVLTREKK